MWDLLTAAEKDAFRWVAKQSGVLDAQGKPDPQRWILERLLQPWAVQLKIKSDTETVAKRTGKLAKAPAELLAQIDALPNGG